MFTLIEIVIKQSLRKCLKEKAIDRKVGAEYFEWEYFVVRKWVFRDGYFETKTISKVCWTVISKTISKTGISKKVVRNLILVNVLYGHLSVLYGDRIRR